MLYKPFNQTKRLFYFKMILLDLKKPQYPEGIVKFYDYFFKGYKLP